MTVTLKPLYKHELYGRLGKGIFRTLLRVCPGVFVLSEKDGRVSIAVLNSLHYLFLLVLFRITAGLDIREQEKSYEP